MGGRLMEVRGGGPCVISPRPGKEGRLDGILPVAHPGDPKAVCFRTGGQIRERCRGVKVLAPVSPVRPGSGMVLDEAKAVELADEVLVG